MAYGGLECRDDLGDFRVAEDERWSEEHVVARGTVDATLNGIDGDIVVEGDLTDALGNTGGGRKGRAGFAVAHEFDAEQKAAAANISDDRRRFEDAEGAAKRVARRSDAVKELLTLNNIEYGVAGGHGHGMGLIRKAMRKCAGASGDRLRHVRRGDDGAEGRVAAGNALAGENHVGRDAPMINGEWATGAAHASHDFVGDEENPVAAANFSDALEVAVGRLDGAESGAGDGFEKKRGDGFGTGLSDEGLEIVGAGDAAVGERFLKGAAVAVAGRDVAPFLEEREIGSTARDVAGNGHGAERGAVVALAAREHADALGLAALEMIGTREFQGGFRGLGAARGEEHAAGTAERRRGERAKALCQAFGNLRLKLGGVGEGEGAGLRGHGVCNFRATVADGDDGSAARGIEDAAAV